MDAKQHLAAYKEVKQEIEALERQLTELRTVATYHRIKGRLHLRSAHQTRPAGATTQPERFTNMSQSEAAKVLLEEAGQPLRTGEIARRMVRGGYPGGDPKKLKSSLYTTMVRQKHTFDRVGPGTWAIAQASNGEEVDTTET